jgi:hypothetical protein
MKLWETGNVGSNNIAKADNNPKEGFKSKKKAKKFLIESYENDDWDYRQNFYTFTIMKLYFNL